jgi:CheY-like chemotaxis protein
MAEVGGDIFYRPCQQKSSPVNLYFSWMSPLLLPNTGHSQSRETMMGAAALPGDWTIYLRVLLLAAIICLVALIILAVRALSIHLLRRRENRRMCAEVQICARPSTPAGTASRAEQQAEQVVDAQNASQNALECAAEDNVSGSVDWQDQPGVEPDAVLGREKTILIADDNPVVTLALSRRLQHLGYQVFRSPDAAHALMGVMKIRPDLVILDVNMPSGNGLAVCEMMACDRQCAGIPVIIHSAFADEAVKRRCRQLGAHHVEKSPQSWDEIKSLVEALIGENKTAQPQPAAPPSRTASKPPVDNATVESPQTPQTWEEVRSAAATKLSAMEKPDSAPTPASSPVAPPRTPPVRGRSRVLCIESPKDRLELVERQLSALGMVVARVSDLGEGYWTCFSEKPHVVVIQIAEDRKELLELLHRLAEHPDTRALPVLVVNEGGALADNDLPRSGNVRIVKYPMDWQDLLGELEKVLPVFARKAEDSLASIAHPNPKTSGTDNQPIGPEGQPLGTAAEQEPPKVLCIDDDPVVARSIAVRLQPYGIKVKGADNGTQGYLMAVTDQPDLILLDLKMPNGEGNYVLSKLKDNKHTKEIPVIILTMESHPGMRRQMFSMGAAAFLTKPVRWPELFAEMGHCIQLPEQLTVDYKLTPQLTLSQL